MEASLLQLYAPRDPLREVLTGEITARQFRVMCEGIPRTPDSPFGRAVNGPWSDLERLVHMGDALLQQILAVEYNSNRKPGAEAFTPGKIPTPPLTHWQKKSAKKKHRKQREPESYLLAVLARNQQLDM